MLKNIMSKKVMNIIFEKLQKRLKLKILKHNKFLLKKLNLNLKDYQDYEVLNELKKNFKLNIKDTDIIKFQNESEKKFGNKIFEYLKKVEFKKLEVLDLSNNRITSINSLDKLNYEKLKELLLKLNSIKDINVLEKVSLNY